MIDISLDMVMVYIVGHWHLLITNWLIAYDFIEIF